MRVWLVIMSLVALMASVSCGSGTAVAPSPAGVSGASAGQSTPSVSTMPMAQSAAAGVVAVASAGQSARADSTAPVAMTSSVAGGSSQPALTPDVAGAVASAGTSAAVSNAGGAGAISAAGSGSAGSGSTGTASAASANCPAQPLTAGDHMFTLKSTNKVTYTYFVHVPKSVDISAPSPVIFKWHAYTSSPEEFRMLEKVDEIADKAKTIMIYPKSPDGSWDTGSCCDFTGVKRDEEVFVRELYKEVMGKVCADPKRIYTTGLSNGAMMSQMLACKMSDVFAAATAVVGTLTIPKAQCTPKRPIPIFMINGTSDPLVGYNRPGLAGGLSVPDDYKFWAEKNKCTGEPETTLEKGKASCKTYKTCAAEVAYCVAEGMGHCMPGMVKESDRNCLTHGTALGPPNDDIDGVQMSSDFLLRFTLP